MRLTERGRRVRYWTVRAAEGVVLCALFGGLTVWFLAHL